MYGILGRDGLPFNYIEYLLENNSNFDLNVDITEQNPNLETAYGETLATISKKEFSNNSISQPNDSVKREILDGIKKQAKINPSNPYNGKTMYIDSDIYDYSFLTSLDDMKIESLPPLSDVKENGKISRNKAVELGLENAKSIGKQVDGEQYAIKNAYTEREIILGKHGLHHSLDGSTIHRLRTNARLSTIGASIVQNAVPINGLKKENQQANGTYAMACLVNDGDGYVVAIVTVDEFDSTVVGIDCVDITHSINGRFLTKKEDSRSSTGEQELGASSLSTTTISKISIAHFLEIVNNSHRSILSDDVLHHFDEEMPSEGHYTNKVLFQKKTTTNRTLLANALESATQNDIERNKITQYKEKIALIESEQAKLAEAKKSFGVDEDGNVIEGGFVDKGGYMGGWYRAGVDVNQEVLSVKKDIEDGRSSLNVDYGMNKLIKEKQSDSYGIKKQVKRIVGESGTDYGIGVYLDSKLSSLSEGERETEVINRLKRLGGKAFTAYDKNGKPVDVHIVKSHKKFLNSRGRKVFVYQHLTNYLKNPVKQEAIMLVDELILTARQGDTEPAHNPHDWLDNNGQNPWDAWTTYIQDKENTVWKAKLQIANSVNGEKILYEVYPIEMVEGVEEIDATPTIGAGVEEIDATTPDDSISHPEDSVKRNFSASVKSQKNAPPPTLSTLTLLREWCIPSRRKAQRKR